MGYWKLDESTWNNACYDQLRDVKDSSGLHYDGMSCPIYTGPTTPVPGKFGNAGYFDGVNDYIRIPASMPELNNTPQFSISFWIKIDSAADCKPGSWNYTGIIARGNGSVSGWRVYFKNIPASNLCFINADVTGSGGTSPEFTNHSVITPGSWHHVVVTYGGNGFPLSIYQDGGVNGGADESITPAVNYLQHSGSLDIGWLSNANPFKGYLDDVRVYNRALIPSEVRALYGSSGGGCL